MSAQPTPTHVADAATAETLRLFRHIYGDQVGYVSLFSGLRPEPTSKDKDLVEETTHHYPYPRAAEFAAGWLFTENSAGREAYMCGHLLKERRRIKENAAAVQALYVDGDGAKVPPHIPAPTAIVESSPDREHYYWRLTHAIDPKRAEDLNRRLTHAMGADKSGYDLSQLLRPVGTINHKHGTTTRLLHLDEQTAYDPDELERILPPAPARPALARLGQGVALEGGEPPVRLSPEDLAVWTGATFVANADGTPDRSRSLFRLAGVLARANASGGAIVAALTERDEALGWRKYADRNDAPDRYGEIALKVLADAPEAFTVAAPAGSGANCARCAPIIAELRQQLEEERRFRVQLLAAMSGPEPVEDAQPLPANQRMVRIVADMEHFSARERAGGNAAPDASTRIRLGTLAKRAGVSTDTASKTLVAAERAGQCTIRRTRDHAGLSELWYRSTAPTLSEALATTAQQVRPPDPETGKVKPWGGKRQRCPHCGGERLLVRTICEDCGGIIDEQHLGADPQDAVPPSIDETPAEATPQPAVLVGVHSTGPQDAEWLEPDPHLAARLDAEDWPPVEAVEIEPDVADAAWEALVDANDPPAPAVRPPDPEVERLRAELAEIRRKRPGRPVATLFDFSAVGGVS
ncbi:MAG TPA: hypothetical protein VIU62_10945 [Chloroflexota bacterium]